MSEPRKVPRATKATVRELFPGKRRVSKTRPERREKEEQVAQQAGRRQQRLFGVKVEQVKERRMRVMGSVNVPFSQPLSLGDTGKITIGYTVKRGRVDLHDDGGIVETYFVETDEIIIDGEVVVPAGSAEGQEEPKGGDEE